LRALSKGKNEKQHILITGAAGTIGKKLVAAFDKKFDLVLMDREKIDHQGYISADLSAYEKRWVERLKGISTVIHLAANPSPNASWEDLIPDNIDSVLNICEACAAHQVDRLIFASSCFTMKGYFDEHCGLITSSMAPRPDTAYGISKMIGERICKSYGEKRSLSVIILRIGWVPGESTKPNVEDNPWLRSLWLSDRDLIHIFERSIEVKDIGFEILYAISRNKGMPWDIEYTEKVLDYRLRDGI
jgi:nucleoside-diphosphate-sugar epimerase